MSFDIVRGIISKPAQTNQLVESVSDYMSKTEDSGTLYLGYPLTASAVTHLYLDKPNPLFRDWNIKLWV